MTDRELMQQALSFLEWFIGDDHSIRPTTKADEIVLALRERLAQPQRTHWEGCEEVHPECKKQEQEPVAWMVYTLDGKSVCVTDNPADFTGQHRVLPLYTTPPQRKPLSDEEIEMACVPLGAAMLSFTEVARAIEAAHGIKGNT